MKKNRFLCFRPVAVKIDTESIGPDSFNDQISSTATTPTNNTSPEISFLSKSPVSAAVERSRFSENDSGTRKKRCKSFSGFALFEISLKKKARDRKATQTVEDSRISSSSKSDHALFTDTLLSFSSSDSPPAAKIPSEDTVSLIKKNHSIDKGPKKTANRVIINGRRRRTSYEGMLLILINLAITVFYGRLCAVLFTCLFLYSICRLRNNSQRVAVPVEKGAAAAVERDYKKRVIMEGLLQRNNNDQRGGH